VTNKISNRHSIDLIEEKSKTIIEELKSALPHKIMLINLLSSAALLFLSSNFKNYGVLSIHDDEFLTIVGSAAGISNGISRLVKHKKKFMSGY
jgi:hypothetical protein